MKYATILVHHSFVLGAPRQKYEWQGERNCPVLVPRNVIRSEASGWPSRLELEGLPPLRWLPGSEDHNWMFLNDVALYVRVDSAGWATWLWWRVRSHTLRVFRFVYERSILTLHVWGLADYQPNRRPSWRDIWLMQKLKSFSYDRS